MSTLTAEVGDTALMIDNVRRDGLASSFGTVGVMDAATELVAVVGSVWHPTIKTGNIAIRKVHFRCGAVTFDAASAIQVSLQNVSATAGPPYQPDGTADQTVAMTALTANGWNTTGNLNADRTVNLANDSLGDANSRWLAVVWEYTTFTASDSIVISSLIGGSTSIRSLGSNILLNTGAWAQAGAGANAGIVVLECDDGTFAFLKGCGPWSAVGNVSVTSNGAIRRAGLKFKFPTERKIDCAGLALMIQNGCDGRLVLYDSDGSTELVSVDIDNDAVMSATDASIAVAPFSQVTLAADTYYRWVFVGGTATAGTVYYGDVNAAGHMDGLILGQNAHWTQHNGTDWADTTTRRPHFALGVSAVHDGAASGGGSQRVIGG